MSKFNELINSSQPVLVDFYADWCGPCKMMAPVLKEIKSDFGTNARIVKIDVDRNQSVAQKYGVQSIPTFILFKEGKPIWRQSGALPKNVLTQAIQSAV